jgi:4'-phosphopantetheinyl transferase
VSLERSVTSRRIGREHATRRDEFMVTAKPVPPNHSCEDGRTGGVGIGGAIVSKPAPDREWIAPRQLPDLAVDEVHVWRAALRPSGQWLARLNVVLNPEELTRASQYRLALDRDDYLATHVVLRFLLGQYTATEPSQLRFRFGSCGKPWLESRGRGAVEFSLSRRNGLALYAFARHWRVGVDVEFLRASHPTDVLVADLFSLPERLALSDLSSPERERAFFTCWTRKEAFLKGTGDGLTHPLDQFSVSMEACPAAVVELGDDAGRPPTDWRIHSVDVGSDYAAALAVESSHARVTFWNWLPAGPGGLGGRSHG